MCFRGFFWGTLQLFVPLYSMIVKVRGQVALQEVGYIVKYPRVRTKLLFVQLEPSVSIRANWMTSIDEYHLDISALLIIRCATRC